VASDGAGRPEMDVRFGPCPPAEQPAVGLIEAMVGELVELYGIGDGELGVALQLDEMGPPGGVYLVGRAGSEVVAGGGLRTVGHGLGEIKRMYVVPAWRGLGIARELLGALQEAARGLGMTRVRLDTGPKQPAARHLYESSGFVTIENYNANPHAAYWGEKVL
jgi:GNAT superfamily N-acetyltransferase